MSVTAIIGSSAASVGAIATLRNNGYQDDIIFFPTETLAAYDRFQIPAWISGHVKDGGLPAVADSFFADHNVKIIENNPVTRINFNRKRIYTAQKNQFPFDKLILSDLPETRLPSVKGSQRFGTFGLARLGDYRTIKSHLSLADTLVIVCHSPLALTVAVSLVNGRNEVIVVVPDGHLLAGALDENAAGFLQEYLEGHSLRFFLNTEITEILGDTDVKAVRLSSGKVVACDMVLLNHVHADTRMLLDTGLHMDGRILVNETFQTSEEGVYACDALAEQGINDPAAYTLSYAAAYRQGAQAALGILGKPGAPPVQEEMYELHLKGLDAFWFGRMAASVETYQRFDAGSKIYQKLGVSAGGRLSGGLILNDSTALQAVKEALEQHGGLIEAVPEELRGERLSARDECNSEVNADASVS